MHPQTNKVPENAIAVIGMDCRFPGANDTRQFWKNLVSGTESITFFTDDELRGAGIHPETIADPTYVRAVTFTKTGQTEYVAKCIAHACFFVLLCVFMWPVVNCNRNSPPFDCRSNHLRRIRRRIRHNHSRLHRSAYSTFAGSLLWLPRAFLLLLR